MGKKTVMEILSECHYDENIREMQKRMVDSYEEKVAYAEAMAKAFYAECNNRGKSCHVSVGGLDSITLLVFLRNIGIDVPAVSVSFLEDASIQRIHEQLGVEALKPAMRRGGVLDKTCDHFGIWLSGNIERESPEDIRLTEPDGAQQGASAYNHYRGNWRIWWPQMEQVGKTEPEMA